MSNVIGKILIVDDENSVRDTLRDILQYENYVVHTATDGIQALELIRSGENYHVVITDLKMPKMNGEQLFEELKKIQKDSVVIFISGQTSQGDAFRLGKNGGYGFMQKPPDLHELLATVKSAFLFKQSLTEIHDG